MYTYFEGVVDLDVGVGETDSSTVVGHNVGDLVLAEGLLGDLAELEACLVDVDGVGLEATFDVVENAEVLASLGDGHDVHEAKRESVVSSDLLVNLDVGVLVLADLDAISVVESVLKSALQKDGKGEAFTELVGAGGRAGGVHSLQFFKAPCGWCVHALKMLLGSTCLSKLQSASVPKTPRVLLWKVELRPNFWACSGAWWGTYHFLLDI